MRLIRIIAQAAFAIGFIVFEIAFKPCHLAITFVGKDMGGDTVQEPAVM
jgi:hypothetical protein